MRHFWLGVILVFLVSVFGCAGLMPNTQTGQLAERVTKVEGQVADLAEMVEMGGFGAVAANFYPFTGGLDGGLTGDLDKQTSTADKDVGFVVVNDYTGVAAEDFLNGINTGDWFAVYSMDQDGGAGDAWPDYGVSGDGGNERWEYSGLLHTEVESIPIGWCIDGTAAPDVIETITSTNRVEVRKFAGVTTNQDVQFTWFVPFDFMPGGTKVQFRVVCYVTHGTAPADTEVVAFSLAGRSNANSELLSAAVGTAQTSSLTANATYAQYDRLATAWCGTDITVTGLAPGETAVFTLIRLATTTDTYGQKIGAVSVDIRYPAVTIVDW